MDKLRVELEQNILNKVTDNNSNNFFGSKIQTENKKSEDVGGVTTEIGTINATIDGGGEDLALKPLNKVHSKQS